MVSRIVGPSTRGVVFVRCKPKTTTSVGEVAVMTDLVALLTARQPAVVGELLALPTIARIV